MSKTVGDQLSDMIVSERVKDMLSMPSRHHDPLGAEQFETLGYRGQIVLQSLGQLRDAHFSVRQQNQQAQPSFVAESPKDGGRSGTSILTRNREGLRNRAVVIPVAFCVSVVSHALLAKQRSFAKSTDR
jgi:hypothetical protein